MSAATPARESEIAESNSDPCTDKPVDESNTIGKSMIVSIGAGTVGVMVGGPIGGLVGAAVGAAVSAVGAAVVHAHAAKK